MYGFIKSKIIATITESPVYTSPSNPYRIITSSTSPFSVIDSLLVAVIRLRGITIDSFMFIK